MGSCKWDGFHMLGPSFFPLLLQLELYAQTCPKHITGSNKVLLLLFLFLLSWEVLLLSHLDQMKSTMKQSKWRMESLMLMALLQGKKIRTFILIIVAVAMEKVRHVNVAKGLYP